MRFKEKNLDDTPKNLNNGAKWVLVVESGKSRENQVNKGVLGAGMFRGIYNNSVDDKGRTVLPARFREQIREQHETPLVLTLGFDQCLFLYPLDVWKKIEEKLAALDSLSAEVRQFQRAILRATDEIEIDPQGRIMLSPVLRKEAGIAKTVVIVGMLQRIEIWDKQRYENYHAQSAQSLELLGQKLSDKGIQSITL
jgi:MraZ protein